MLKLVHMKGQMVGSSEILIWPDHVAMVALRAISRPHNKLVSTDANSSDLLWPAQLINEQARLKHRHDYSQPIAIITFIFSIILAVIIGPLQLALIASSNDYNWVTTVYFPEALRYAMLIGSFITVISIIALVLAWHSQPKRTRMTITLTASTILTLWLIWLSGQVVSWQPHHITVILAGAIIICLTTIILLSKQYITEQYNHLLTKIILILLIISSLFNTIGGIMYYQASAQIDPVKLSQISANQTAARIQGVPEELSDTIFTLCNGKYQVVYISNAAPSGIFECSQNGDVYSATELSSNSDRVLKTAATYLGTTKDTSISRAFPNSYYLYRNMPDILDENELVLMLPASSEQELVDNFAPLLLAYWQDHNQQNLFLNVFYNNDFGAITSTRDYILMTALGTMTLTDKLPNGDNIVGYHNGKQVNYHFTADRDLIALNELGADPSLYASSSRDALKTHRHISLHLKAGEEIDPARIRSLLQESFTGGL